MRSFRRMSSIGTLDASPPSPIRSSLSGGSRRRIAWSTSPKSLPATMNTSITSLLSSRSPLDPPIVLGRILRTWRCAWRSLWLSTGWKWSSRKATTRRHGLPICWITLSRWRVFCRQSWHQGSTRFKPSSKGCTWLHGVPLECYYQPGIG